MPAYERCSAASLARGATLILVTVVLIFITKNICDNGKADVQIPEYPVFASPITHPVNRDVNQLRQIVEQILGEYIDDLSLQYAIKVEIKRILSGSMGPDFASEFTGGSIISASPTWTEGYNSFDFLFIKLKSTAPTPNKIIRPTAEAGDCWPMKGETGYVVIQLAARIFISAFTLEHIKAHESLCGDTSEAPKTFTVYGIDPQSNDSQEHDLGTYEYNNNKEGRQTFPIQKKTHKSYIQVKLQILQNNGNPYYTCLYRFKVHGKIDGNSRC